MTLHGICRPAERGRRRATASTPATSSTGRTGRWSGSTPQSRRPHRHQAPGRGRRYGPWTRANHWLTAACLILLLISGLGFFHPSLFFLTGLFGGGQTRALIHPWIGVVLFVSFLGLFFRMVRLNLPRSRGRDLALAPRRGPRRQGGGAARARQVQRRAEVRLLGDDRADHRPDRHRRDDVGAVFRRPGLDPGAAGGDDRALDRGGADHPAPGSCTSTRRSGRAGTIRAMTRGTVTGGWAWRHHRKWLRELARTRPRPGRQNSGDDHPDPWPVRPGGRCPKLRPRPVADRVIAQPPFVILPDPCACSGAGPSACATSRATSRLAPYLGFLADLAEVQAALAADAAAGHAAARGAGRAGAREPDAAARPPVARARRRHGRDARGAARGCRRHRDARAGAGGARRGARRRRGDAGPAPRQRAFRRHPRRGRRRRTSGRGGGAGPCRPPRGDASTRSACVPIRVGVCPCCGGRPATSVVLGDAAHRRRALRRLRHLRDAVERGARSSASPAARPRASATARSARRPVDQGRGLRRVPLAG